MARSKINLDQIAWAEISSGSLAGPASFIGLNTNNEIVLIAASDYTTGGGGSGISHDGSTANGVLTYKDSDEATVESNLTFDGSSLTVAGDDVRLKLNGDTDSHPGVELYENGTRKWIIYNNYGGDNLDFKTNSDIRMSIEQAGNVGIGTTSPDTKAHIMAGDASATSNSVSTLTLEDNDHVGLQFLSPNDKAVYIMCGDPQSDFAGGIRYHHSDNSLAFKVNGNYYFQITSAGAAKFSGSVELGDSVTDNIFVNGTLTGSNGIKLAGIPTGSLAGPASFLGVDTTNRVVQVAASDYVAAAGGSDTFVIDHFGHFKWTNDNIMGHAAYGYNNRYNYINVSLSGKATYDDKDSSQMTASIVNSLLYIRSGILPVACTLDGFTVDGYWTENLSNGNAKWSMWQCTPPSNATDYDGNVTWTRIGSVTWAGTGTDDHFYKGSTTISSNNSYAAGDWWALTVQPGGSDVYIGSSNSNFAMAATWSPT